MKKFLMIPAMALAPMAMADRYDVNYNNDADTILAVSTAAVGGAFALTILSETSEANEAQAYHRRMIKEGKRFLRNTEKFGEQYAASIASDEFLERLALERAENSGSGKTTIELVVQIIKEEERALDNN